jgi:hypothetical protein
MVFNATFNNISFVKFITIEMYMYIFFRWLFLREWIFESNLASKANPVMSNEPIILSLHIYFLLYIQWCRLFGYCSKTLLSYLAFQYYDIEHTWWRLFQKRVLRTKFVHQRHLQLKCEICFICYKVWNNFITLIKIIVMGKFIVKNIKA